MVGPLHSPSAPHTELLPPLLHTKPSSQTNMATLPYLVPETDSSSVSSTEAGWPQSTTDKRDKNIQNSALHPPTTQSAYTLHSGGTVTVLTARTNLRGTHTDDIKGSEKQNWVRLNLQLTPGASL